MSKLTMFISYVHDDAGIADAVRNALQSAFGDDILVFQDKVSIQQGENLQDTISVNLKNSDALIVISTGTDRPSHDWAGWELGYFHATHANSDTDDPGSLKGKIVTFCSARNAPRPMNNRLYVTLDVDAKTLEKSEKDFEAELHVDDEDPIVLWLGQLLKTIQCLNLKDRRDMLDRYKRTVKELKLKVFVEFKRRPKSVLRPQKQLKVRYTRDEKNPAQSLRDTAIVTMHGQATAVFGISSELEKSELSWQRFVGLLTHNVELGRFWTGTLERLLISAYDLDIDNSQIIASHDQRDLYRIILTTSTTYYNRTIDTSIYFVEVFRRPDYGNPETSMLLKGLQIVCRFRFLFLEQQSEFHCLNVRLADAPALRSIAARIVAELDILTSDTFQANLNRPAAWTKFVDARALLAMGTMWEPLRSKLMEACATTIASREDTVTDARDKLADTLEVITEQCGPHNSLLLAAMANKLMEYSQLHSRQPTGNDQLLGTKTNCQIVRLSAQEPQASDALQT